ncbi:MAG: hypothetical protein QM666_00375 [Acinetobacter sp.]
MLSKPIKPAMELIYVKMMMDVIARGLVGASETDQTTQQELQKFPEGFTLSMKVFPNGPSFVAKINDNKHLVLVKNPENKPNLTIIFKHLHHAYLVFSFQESTAQAFANDRMIADGDLSYAIRLVRCLNRMESLILPKMVANHAVKDYPDDLKLKEKLSRASAIYIKLAQSYFKRSV